MLQLPGTAVWSRPLQPRPQEALRYSEEKCVRLRFGSRRSADGGRHESPRQARTQRRAARPSVRGALCRAGTREHRQPRSTVPRRTRSLSSLPWTASRGGEEKGGPPGRRGSRQHAGWKGPRRAAAAQPTTARGVSSGAPSANAAARPAALTGPLWVLTVVAMAPPSGRASAPPGRPAAPVNRSNARRRPSRSARRPRQLTPAPAPPPPPRRPAATRSPPLLAVSKAVRDHARAPTGQKPCCCLGGAMLPVCARAGRPARGEASERY